MKRAFLALLLFAPLAHAEFTPVEKVEGAKYINALVVLSQTWREVDLSTPDRAQVYSVLKSIVAPYGLCVDGWQLLSSTTKNGTTDRAAEVSKAISRADSCQTSLRNLAAKLQDGAALVAAADQLATFDSSLTYTSPYPNSFPRVGDSPHGDYLTSQKSLTRTVQYLVNDTYDFINLYGSSAVWPSDANEDFGALLASLGEVYETVSRAQGLIAGVALPDDQAIVAQDSADQGGHRPMAFFDLLLSIEYIHGSGARNFNGRITKVGFTQHLAPIAAHHVAVIGYLAQANTDAEFFRFFEGGTGGRNANSDGTGRAMAAIVDLADFWNTVDKWFANVLEFRHEILPNASGPPPDIVCGTGTMSSGTVCENVVTCPPETPERRLTVSVLDSSNEQATIRLECRE